jgi:inosine-uridine nucleoside N-ribohydrolase
VPRKVIIDCDPGIDDAVALALALFDPRLEVLAVTASGGNVTPEQATGNLQSLLKVLDPPRLPRVGVAPADVMFPERPYSLHGSDGLGGLDLPRANLHGAHVAEKVIWETLRAHPREVTIIALGPLTNVSRAIARDPTIVDLMHGLVACGGTVHGHGTATAVADFNFYCDPPAARHVVREPLTKTLVPLETTGQVVFGFDLLDHLPDESSRAGMILRRMLAHSFRAHRQILGSEGIFMHDVVALVSVMHPELFERSAVTADVETKGDLTAGMLVIDRRRVVSARHNADLLTACDSAAVTDCVIRGLTAAGAATE